jgi:hypothetical protein
MWRWTVSTRPGLSLTLCLGITLAACQGPPGDRQSGRGPTGQAFTIDETLQTGETRYVVEPNASRAVILVRREGPLARFGHDHALVARPAEGFVIWSPDRVASGRAALGVDVRSIEVDPPEVRAEFSLDTTPDQEAVSGTRSNLLEHVLPADSWPVIYMTVRVLDGNPPNLQAKAVLVINDHQGEIRFPMKVLITGDRLSASGSFAINQRAWGIEPFSILGGGLRVADRIQIEFAIEAGRDQAQDR